MRNLQSAANGIARSTGNLAAKGTKQTFKWMTNQTPGNAEYYRNSKRFN